MNGYDLSIYATTECIVNHFHLKNCIFTIWTRQMQTNCSRKINRKIQWTAFIEFAWNFQIRRALTVAFYVRCLYYSNLIHYLSEVYHACAAQTMTSHEILFMMSHAIYTLMYCLIQTWQLFLWTIIVFVCFFLFGANPRNKKKWFQNLTFLDL